ncbi:hypothetical protein C2S52_001800 [Perilla frutescens var. hirtella]|nr:hypothetical protein C2S52_001800 [Perilla frutescens var. hirtella]
MVEILERGVSDHCPQLIKLEDDQLKQPLKNINKLHFRNIPEKITRIREELKAIQSQLIQDKLNEILITEEKRLLAEIEKWNKVEESIWKQKFRVNWIKFGDSNTKYFHVYAKARQNCKAIKMLIKMNGDRCTTQSQIKEEIRTFYLNLMGSAAERLPMVDPTVVNQGPVLTHEDQLKLYDLLMFSRGDLSSVRQMMKALNKFSEASGLQANPAKSLIYFGGVASNVQDMILQEFGLVKGGLPFKYLGVPLSYKKISISQCQGLINKILARINCWSSKLISYAGRVQLIKSVLFGVQSFWSQVFLLPKKVLKAIETACRIFLWTGKSNYSERALVAWDHICLPKAAGGWNIVNMLIWNKAAICKLLWSISHKSDKLWVKWIHGYYIKHQDLTTINIPSQASWVVRKILAARNTILLSRSGAQVLQ